MGFMKCVNATWEERNLGVKTIEVSLEKKDASLSDEDICGQIEDFRNNCQAKYVVVKTDTKYPRISQLLQKNKYLLIESQIGLKLTREDAKEKYELYKDVFPGISYSRVDNSQLEYVMSEINKGIFTTDRIALDPFFGVNTANKRYALWVQDEVRRGADIFFSCYNNYPIGFFLGKDLGNGNIKGLLGGIFVGENTRNYGGLYLFSSIKCFLDGTGKVDRTMVSSNNVPILQLHLMFGRKVTNISNVFIRHFE
ncbi:hypothetical protein D081_1057 [Anaerovibrio sp. JC8]|uniref:hypothetical protein n=1 Tax=Anaerovibrio sp. JC8 TaxID=1240085 RepID=UPI000A09F764|nr:hypothetical protein [Anaerovibrio sp. JC8]ORU00534.1 hypothetical protein D081_1057 [Anaerovibrio sp. JC8]